MSMTPLSAGRSWGFVAACALAGGLAVPFHLAVTPTAAALAGTLALLSLRVWCWSHLPELRRQERGTVLWRAVLAARWAALGLVIGLVFLGVIRAAIEPVLPAIGARIAAAGRLPLWRRGLIIYVAAVGEELVFRVFLLSALAGLIARVSRLQGQVPNPATLRAANALSASAFALAHLPSWVGIAPADPRLMAWVVAFNGAAGLVMGRVFIARGILAAVWIHAAADSAIQLLGPLSG